MAPSKALLGALSPAGQAQARACIVRRAEVALGEVRELERLTQMPSQPHAGAPAPPPAAASGGGAGARGAMGMLDRVFAGLGQSAGEPGRAGACPDLVCGNFDPQQVSNYINRQRWLPPMRSRRPTRPWSRPTRRRRARRASFGPRRSWPRSQRQSCKSCVLCRSLLAVPAGDPPVLVPVVDPAVDDMLIELEGAPAGTLRVARTGGRPTLGSVDSS
mmetsp:Transcript_4714/g.11929  ORF Transcript_4714/g.11929 Transcript_4714/m.11929 type:complete len:217 (-) Transcript_4714:171-821(-)